MSFSVTDFHGGKLTAWNLGTCGLTTTHRIKSTTSPEKILAEAFKKTAWRDENNPEGNLLFSVTSKQLLKEGENYRTAWTDYLLDHPNTRVIHWYLNNAHGPEIIFICMLHLHPDEVLRPKWKNNVDYYRKRIVWDSEKYRYTMKDPE